MTTALKAGDNKRVIFGTDADLSLVFNSTSGKLELLDQYDVVITSWTPAGLLTLLGDLACNGGDMTSSAAAFNFLLANVLTFVGLSAATSISFGAATGTFAINNALATMKGLTQAGPIIRTPSATQTITAAGGITTAMLALSHIIRVVGDGGAIDITANPQIAAGTDGQIIELVGTHDTNTVKFDDGTGLKLVGAASATLGLGDCLNLRYNATGAVWRERFRANI
jgi:hypothetical protein